MQLYASIKFHLFYSKNTNKLCQTLIFLPFLSLPVYRWSLVGSHSITYSFVKYSVYIKISFVVELVTLCMFHAKLTFNIDIEIHFD